MNQHASQLGFKTVVGVRLEILPRSNQPACKSLQCNITHGRGARRPSSLESCTSRVNSVSSFTCSKSSGLFLVQINQLARIHGVTRVALSLLELRLRSSHTGNGDARVVRRREELLFCWSQPACQSTQYRMSRAGGYLMNVFFGELFKG